MATEKKTSFFFEYENDEGNENNAWKSFLLFWLIVNVRINPPEASILENMNCNECKSPMSCPQSNASHILRTVISKHPNRGEWWEWRKKYYDFSLEFQSVHKIYVQ